MKKKVFVTGGTGFIGSYICRLLVLKGFLPIVLKRESSALALLEPVIDDVEFVEGDLYDLVLLTEIMKEVDYVIHSAAIISFEKKDREKMFYTNVRGTAYMVNAALQSGVKKFIHISSVAAFGKSEIERVIDENSSWIEDDLNTNYGISKHLAEREIYRGCAEGLNATIISPSFVIGGGFWNKGTTSIISKIDEGLWFYTKGSNGVVDVRDVAKLSVNALEKEIPSEKIIANGHNVVMKEFLSDLAIGLDKKPPKYLLNPIIGNLGCITDYIKSTFTGRSRLLTRESLKGSFINMKYTNTRSRTLLDQEYISLDVSVHQICALFKRNKSEGKNFGLLDF